MYALILRTGATASPRARERAQAMMTMVPGSNSCVKNRSTFFDTL